MKPLLVSVEDKGKATVSRRVLCYEIVRSPIGPVISISVVWGVCGEY